MIWEIVLAFAAGAIAVYGIFKNPSETLRAVCVVAAAVMVAASIIKVIDDNQEKDLLREGVAGNMRPTARIIKNISDEVVEVAQQMTYDVKDANYLRVTDGMVFYLKNKEHQPEDIIFDNSELGEMYANLLSKKGNYKIIKEAIETEFDLTKYNEDMYNRIAILLATSMKQETNAEPLDYSYDDKKGFMAFFVGGNGKVQFPPSILQSVPQTSFGQVLARLDGKFRDGISKAKGTATPVSTLGEEKGSGQ